MTDIIDAKMLLKIRLSFPDTFLTNNTRIAHKQINFLLLLYLFNKLPDTV